MAGMCFCFGHSDTPEWFAPVLQTAIEHLICQMDVTDFMVGHYGNFDRMVAHAVIEAKNFHSNVTLTLLRPYHPAERPIPLPKGFDGSFYPPSMHRIPRRFAIPRANRYMIDQAQHLIACVCYPASNSFELLHYAQKRAQKTPLHIVNIGTLP